MRTFDHDLPEVSMRMGQCHSAEASGPYQDIHLHLSAIDRMIGTAVHASRPAYPLPNRTQAHLRLNLRESAMAASPPTVPHNVPFLGWDAPQ